MSYLKRLYRESKWLFAAALLFISGQVFFTYKGIENAPFWHWGMYSRPVHEKDLYPVLHIEINGDQFFYTRMSDTERQVVIGPLRYYAGWLVNGEPTERVIDSRTTGQLNKTLKQRLLSPDLGWLFPFEYTRLLNEHMHGGIEELLISQEKYQYQGSAPEFVSTDTLFIYP